MKASTTLGDNNHHCVIINATGNVAFTQAQTAQLPAQKQWFKTKPRNPNDLLSLLHWESRISGRIGRDAEFDDLLQWTDGGDPGIQARLISGDGGAGKSRLAADLAEALVARGWRAEKLSDRLTEQDLLPLGDFHSQEPKRTLADRLLRRQPTNKPTYKGGLLIVIDYPEGRKPLVEQLLTSLWENAGEDNLRIRVLLLSRQDMQDWQPVIDRAGAGGLFPAPPIYLARSTDPAAQFASMLAGFATVLEKEAPSLPAGEPERWLASNHAYHQPLFLAAVALNFCLNPAQGLALGGPDAVTALVRRERLRAERESVALGWPPDLLPRLLALATLRGGLDAAKLNELGQMLGLPAGGDLCDRLRHACDGRIRENILVALEPDLPGAAFATLVLSERGDKAPDWIWQTIADNPMGLIPRLERVCHDAEGTLQLLPDHRISRLLVMMVTGKPDRAQALRGLAVSGEQSHRLASLAAMIGQVLLDDVALEDSDRAELLNVQSVHLFDSGDVSGALDAVAKAVAIYEELAAANPAQFNTDLAGSLNNLSNCLSEVGNDKGALAAVTKAVMIYDELAVENPVRFYPHLAMSLNNFSNRLSKTGDGEGALAAILKVIAINEQVATANPTRASLHWAMSLETLSNSFFDVGNVMKALEAIVNAVAIYERLAEENPARFNPDLARSLNNLSVRRTHAGDQPGSLDAIRKGVGICQKLALENPDRFNPDLAIGLTNLSISLSESGDRQGALDASRQALKIKRDLAAVHPDRFNSGLAGMLATCARYTDENGDREQAIRLMEEAITLITPQANTYPRSQEGRWLAQMQQDLARLRQSGA